MIKNTTTPTTTKLIENLRSMVFALMVGTCLFVKGDTAPEQKTPSKPNRVSLNALHSNKSDQELINHFIDQYFVMPFSEKFEAGEQVQAQVLIEGIVEIANNAVEYVRKEFPNNGKLQSQALSALDECSKGYFQSCVPEINGVHKLIEVGFLPVPLARYIGPGDEHIYDSIETYQNILKSSFVTDVPKLYLKIHSEGIAFDPAKNSNSLKSFYQGLGLYENEDEALIRFVDNGCYLPVAQAFDDLIVVNKSRLDCLARDFNLSPSEAMTAIVANEFLHRQMYLQNDLRESLENTNWANKNFGDLKVKDGLEAEEFLSDVSSIIVCPEYCFIALSSTDKKYNFSREQIIDKMYQFLLNHNISNISKENIRGADVYNLKRSLEQALGPDGYKECLDFIRVGMKDVALELARSVVD